MGGAVGLNSLVKGAFTGASAINALGLQEVEAVAWGEMEGLEQALATRQDAGRTVRGSRWRLHGQSQRSLSKR